MVNINQTRLIEWLPAGHMTHERKKVMKMELIANQAGKYVYRFNNRLDWDGNGRSDYQQALHLFNFTLPPEKPDSYKAKALWNKARDMKRRLRRMPEKLEFNAALGAEEVNYDSFYEAREAVRVLTRCLAPREMELLVDSLMNGMDTARSSSKALKRQRAVNRLREYARNLLEERGF